MHPQSDLRRPILAFLLCSTCLAFASAAHAQATVAEAEARVADPFFTRSTFSIARTLYVATNEPGASNSNNGKFPTYRGGLDGPFKDLNSTVVRQALACSDLVVADSEATRCDLADVYGTAADRVEVLYPVVADPSEPLP